MPGLGKTSLVLTVRDDVTLPAAFHDRDGLRRSGTHLRDRTGSCRLTVVEIVLEGKLGREVKDHE